MNIYLETQKLLKDKNKKNLGDGGPHALEIKPLGIFKANIGSKDLIKKSCSKKRFNKEIIEEEGRRHGIVNFL